MRKNICCFVFLLLTLFSCRKTDYNPSVFTEASFPLAVGNWWQYQLTSSFGIDTFILTAISINITGSYLKYQCNIQLNGVTIDSGYFLQSDTSLSFINMGNTYYSPFPNFYLRFPVKAGYYWPGAFAGDSILVAAVVDSTEEYHHTYKPAYILTESYDLPHNHKVENMTLTPKIGLVNQSIYFDSDTADASPSYGGGVQVQQSIVLLKYYVQ